MTVRIWDRVCRESEGGGSPPPGAGAPPAPQTPPAASPPASSGGSETLANARAERAAEKVAREAAESRAAALQRQLEEATAQHQAAIELARTQAVEPLQSRLRRLEAQTIDAVLLAEATAAGLRDPDLLGLRERMPDAPAVTCDENGVVTGAKDVIAKFKTWKPEYFQPAGVAPPAPGGGLPPRVPSAPPPQQRPGAITTVKGMNKQEYAAWKSDQLRAMRTA